MKTAGIFHEEGVDLGADSAELYKLLYSIIKTCKRQIILHSTFGGVLSWKHI